jgi:hypothetical protein
MIHPNLNDLSELTDPQLEEKIQTLNRYYHITDNSDVRQQMILLLDSYKIELEERRIAAKKKQQEEEGDNGLDNLINVS